MSNPREKALKLCQDIAMTSFGSDFNEGTTLPLDITKKIAIICVDEIMHTSAVEYEYHEKFWRAVKEEISKI